MHIQLEPWMGLGEELGEDFQSPSAMISRIEVEVEEGRHDRFEICIARKTEMDRRTQ